LGNQGVRPGVNPALFISDLHLSPARPAIAERFLRFVAEEARSASALFILGDFFDRWLGDDDAGEAFNRRLLDALRALAGAGVAVRLMHGNRDFLFGEDAARGGGLELLVDPSLQELFGVRTLLMHGDLLCTDDRRYQRYRARVRRPGVIRAFRALPRAVREAIGGGLRRVSESEKQVKAPVIMDVNAGAVEETLRRYGYPRLIHGHTHRPGKHVHVVDGHACERWVLGDWYERGSYLRCDERGCEAVALV
jgi:UDP-2,3-diacylglucosamine hydrolase